IAENKQTYRESGAAFAIHGGADRNRSALVPARPSMGSSSDRGMDSTARVSAQSINSYRNTTEGRMPRPQPFGLAGNASTQFFTGAPRVGDRFVHFF
ncbi:MAG: hypothetical protein WCT14_15700, partial [Treponemataceae bacterium]